MLSDWRNIEDELRFAKPFNRRPRWNTDGRDTRSTFVETEWFTGTGGPLIDQPAASQRESQYDSQTTVLELSNTPSPASSIITDSSEVQRGENGDVEVLQSQSSSASSAAYQWGRAETLLLLDLYREHLQELQDTKTKKIRVWAKVASAIQRQGYKVTAVQCLNRWNTLRALYRRTVDHNNKTGLCTLKRQTNIAISPVCMCTGRNRRACEFYSELHEILGSRPEFGAVNVASSYTSSLPTTVVTEDEETDTAWAQKTSHDTLDKSEQSGIEADTENYLPP